MNKKFKLIAILLTVLALTTSGTFAWQKAYEKTNEFSGHKKDVTVHDDFDPDTGKKDVYVENHGETVIFVRVKLDEAMNLTSDTWRPGVNDWVTHTYNETAVDCGHTNKADDKYFHDYFKWTMGGWKYYMPGNSSQSIMQDKNMYNGTEPGVKKTPDAQIITSADFLAMSESNQKAFIGWIYSTDGYAYWSQPLQKDEATGLLLHGVQPQPNLNELDYYYAINVIVEVVDRRDVPMWTEGANATDGSGATHQEATPDGKEVIYIITGGGTAAEPSITLTNIPATVTVGGTVNPPTVTVGPAGSPDSPLEWATDSPGIAVVGTDGVITGISEGDATITVKTPNGLSASFTITVTGTGTVDTGNVSINGGDVNIEVGVYYTPGITITPPDIADKPHWTSSNPGVATVNSDTGEIIGMSEGVAIITVTVGDKSDSIQVIVTDYYASTDLPLINGAGPYTPDLSQGNGLYAKHNFIDNSEIQNHYLWNNGSIRLSDVISDGNIDGVKAEAADDYYKPYIYVGYNQHEELSVMYSYIPTLEQIQERYKIDENITIPVDVILTRVDGKSATITINMIYTDCLFVWNEQQGDI